MIDYLVVLCCGVGGWNHIIRDKSVLQVLSATTYAHTQYFELVDRIVFRLILLGFNLLSQNMQVFFVKVAILSMGNGKSS